MRNQGGAGKAYVVHCMVKPKFLSRFKNTHLNVMVCQRLFHIVQPARDTIFGILRIIFLCRNAYRQGETVGGNGDFTNPGYSYLPITRSDKDAFLRCIAGFDSLHCRPGVSSEACIDVRRIELRIHHHICGRTESELYSVESAAMLYQV